MCAAKSAKHLNANRRTIRRTADPPLSLSPSLPFFSSPLYRPALFYLSAIPSNHSAIPNYAILSIESAIHYDGIVPVSHKHLWRAFFFLFLLLLLPAQKSMFFFCLCLHNKKKKKFSFLLLSWNFFYLILCVVFPDFWILDLFVWDLIWFWRKFIRFYLENYLWLWKKASICRC